MAVEPAFSLSGKLSLPLFGCEADSLMLSFQWMGSVVQGIKATRLCCRCPPPPPQSVGSRGVGPMSCSHPSVPCKAEVSALLSPPLHRACMWPLCFLNGNLMEQIQPCTGTSLQGPCWMTQSASPENLSLMPGLLPRLGLANDWQYLLLPSSPSFFNGSNRRKCVRIVSPDGFAFHMMADRC